MSPGRLDAIRRETGLIMGWKAQSYTARRFVEDLNQLHPGLVSIAADGQPYRPSTLSKALGSGGPSASSCYSRQRRKPE